MDSVTYLGGQYLGAQRPLAPLKSHVAEWRGKYLLIFKVIARKRYDVLDPS